MNVAYNMDCMEAMRKMPDKAFELAIVDPPYGISATKMKMGAGAPSRGGNTSFAVADRKGRLNAGAGKLKDRAIQNLSCDWDYKPPTPEYFAELFRVSQNQIIWGGNYFDLPPTRGIVCWDKEQPWENFSQWEMAWTSLDTPAAMYRLSTTKASAAEGKIHPTQKPVALYKWLLRKYAKQGDRILDTHLGSGSSRIAAYDMGFDFTGYEIDPDYFKAQEERYKRHTAQLNFFVGADQ